jgi:hypothetical protein
VGVIVINNDNLFSLAARLLGDATMWIYIAEVNGVKDPMVRNMMTLNVPSTGNLRGGGIVLQ